MNMCIYIYNIYNSVGHYPSTALKQENPLAGEWPKLFRENNVETTRLCHGWCPPVFGKFSQRAAQRFSTAPSTAHGARSAAATELQRSRCCDGDTQTSSVALILRVASRRAEWGASIIPAGWFKFQFVAHSPRPPPWPRNINEIQLYD